MVYIALVKCNDEYYIKADRDGGITAFETARKGLDHFEDGYKGAHGRGREGSASACINFMSFQPSIIAVKDVEDIRTRLIADDGPRLVTMSNVSGYMTGLTTDKAKAETEWKNGVTPRLI